MAWRVEDLQLVLNVIGGVDWRDASTVPMPLDDARGVSMTGLRVAWYTRTPDTSATPETIAATEAAAAALSDAGAVVTEAMPPRLEDAFGITVSYWQRPDSVSLNR